MQPITPIPPVFTQAPVVPEPPKKSYKWLIVAVIAFLLASVSVFAYQNYRLKQQLAQVPLSPSLFPAVSPSSIPSGQLPVSSPSPSPASLFLISLNLKSTTALPPIATGPQSEYANLADYLNSVLGLPKKTLTQLYYDTRYATPYGSNETPYQSKFYIHFNQPLVLKDSYEDQYVKVIDQSVDISLLPYLIKSDYCQQDSDCAIGADMCTYGAFNFYRKYYDPPWGCGPGGYKNNFSWFKWGEHDDKLNCAVELKFAGAKCVNNQCTESNYEKVCTNVGNP